LFNEKSPGGKDWSFTKGKQKGMVLLLLTYQYVKCLIQICFSIVVKQKSGSRAALIPVPQTI
jgi:hypothetical protein